MNTVVIDGIPTVRPTANKDGKYGMASTMTLSTFSSSFGNLSQLDSSDITSSSETSSAGYQDEEAGLPLLHQEPEALIPHKPSKMDFFLEPKISLGNHSIPLQSESRPWLKYLIWIPISTFSSMVFFAYFWLPILQENGVFEYLQAFGADTLLKNRLALYLLIAPMATGLVYDICTEIWTFVMLLKGKQRRHLPAHMPRLVHAVIVCNYKEPLEVLRATVASIADQTLAENTMVILACEARDAGADDTFAALASEFQGRLRSFTKTTHVLAAGEVVGKSSNENHACRELYKMIEQEGLDPFQVMVTTCDADSLFDRVFLEQVEAEYCRTPDGRRFIYNSPINTYRNLAECHPIVKAFEVRRCQFDLFNGLDFRPAQSNYSLTLGFAREINYWDPSNTSEDFHTTLKAMAMTGKGTEVVVKVWSLILNDSVTGFSDRWTQAKRHMWGIEETAFVLTLFPILRINQWLQLFGRVGTQMFGVCIPASVWFCFAPVREVFFSLNPQTQYLLVGMMVFGMAYDWIKTFIREVLLYKLIIGNRQLMQKRTTKEWMQLFVAWPLVAGLSTLIFATAATWRMLLHAVRHDTLVYITAPKALTVDSNASSGSNSKPKKSA